MLDSENSAHSLKKKKKKRRHARPSSLTPFWWAGKLRERYVLCSVTLIWPGAGKRDSSNHPLMNPEEYVSLLGWTGHSTLVDHWELNARDVLTITGLNRLVYRCCFHIPDVTFTHSNQQPRNVCIYPSEFVQLHSRDYISSRKKVIFVILDFLPMNA